MPHIWRNHVHIYEQIPHPNSNLILPKPELSLKQKIKNVFLCALIWDCTHMYSYLINSICSYKLIKGYLLNYCNKNNILLCHDYKLCILLTHQNFTMFIEHLLFYSFQAICFIHFNSFYWMTALLTDGVYVSPLWEPQVYDTTGWLK